MESWHDRFRENLQTLFKVTPFYNSTEGYFEQEFRGEWSASSASAKIDIDEVISEHELYTEEEAEAELSWFESFIAGIT